MKSYENALIEAFNIALSTADDLDNIVILRDHLRIAAPEVKNLGDIPYTFRYRRTLPEAIQRHAPHGKVWLIKGDGDGRYLFRAVLPSDMTPNPALPVEEFRDQSLPIVQACRKNDEQGILAMVGDNDLIGRFLDLTAGRVQSHVRTKLRGIGQVEIDDLYAGIDASGQQFIIPIQAKGAKDRCGPAQTLQDLAFCETWFPDMICRPLSIHYDPKSRRIAMMELRAENDVIAIVRERHFRAT